MNGNDEGKEKLTDTAVFSLFSFSFILRCTTRWRDNKVTYMRDTRLSACSCILWEAYECCFAIEMNV